MLVGIITLGQGVGVNALLRMGVDFTTIRAEVEKKQKKNNKEKNNHKKQKGYHSYSRLKKVIALAGKEAKELNHSYVGTEHLLLGLLRDEDGIAFRILNLLDIDIETCRNEILTEIDPNFESDNLEEAMAGSSSEQKNGSSKTPALKSFGRDLTKLATEGKLDPVVGRKKKFQELFKYYAEELKTIQF